ncbi:MAG TPA: hypothetical protein VEX36_11185 [Thermoleophilaceae bacterium]|nr:hypothetical protein [Thermoleophilaceae bacterium]
MRQRGGGGLRRRSVRLALGRLWLEAVVPATDAGHADPAAAVRQAVYYYLSDAGSGRAGWTHPRFGRGAEQTGPTIEVAVTVDEGSWQAFVGEAANQGVSVDELVRHALLYFAADLDAGRVAARILDDQAER